jgi:YfiH family protein
MMRFFEKYPEVLAIMSEREDGSMRLFDNGNLIQENIERRKKYFKKLGVKFDNVISAYLINETKIKIIENKERGIISKTDGLVTNKKNIYLSVTAADCIPVLFYDFKSKIVGVAHAGWRGVVGNIIKKTVDNIFKLGGNAESIAVSMGPGIKQCHFEISKDILDKFNTCPEFIERRENKYVVNLKGIIKKQLTEIGIKNENIDNNNDCTFCNEEKYFSYRRENQKDVGLMIALIGLK